MQVGTHVASCHAVTESKWLAGEGRERTLAMSEMAVLLAGVAAKLLLMAAGAFYALLVLSTYAREGPNFQLRLRSNHPARSAERLLIWAGIKMILAIARAVRSILNVLYQASADVGTWVVSKSSAQVQARVLSRFL